MSDMGDVKISVEELQQEIVGSQAGGVDHIAAANEVTRERWLESIYSRGMERLVTGDESQYGELPRRIHKVPVKFRGETDFKSFYEPSAVSIGPYHYHKRNDKLRKMEDVKVTTAGLFLRRFTPYVESGKPENVQFFNDFGKKIIEGGVREWYEKDSTKDINEEDFIRMMFLDGCFIIMFMRSITMGLVEAVLGMSKYTINKVQRDIFMLENQLPFPVLEALCCTERVGKSIHLIILDRYIQYCTIGYNGYFRKDIEDEVEDAKPLHLLDLLRIRWLGKDKPNSYSFDGRHMELSTTSYLVRNVKELTAGPAGISLRPNSSHLLTDIHFSCFLTGTLRLPRIIIDEFRKTIFLNAIAQEACTKNKFGMTSYVRFLDSLIDNADDVKVMRSSGVLQNLPSSDQKVADFFNKIGALVEPEGDAYIDVKRDMGKYFESSVRKKLAAWRNEMIRDYCRSPWTIIGVLAGSLLLFLTLVQTYSAVLE